MMSVAAAAAAGLGRGRALGGPGQELEPELEEGETRVAGGGHGDEPGLADAAPSQSGWPRGEPGRVRADGSQLPWSPLSAARRRGSPGRAPQPLSFQVDLGAQGSGAGIGPAPGRARRWGAT